MNRSVVAVLGMLLLATLTVPAAAHEIRNIVRFHSDAVSCAEGKAELDHTTYGGRDIVGTEGKTLVFNKAGSYCLTLFGTKSMPAGHVIVYGMLANRSNGAWCVSTGGWVSNTGGNGSVTTYAASMNWPASWTPPCGAGTYVYATSHGVWQNRWIMGNTDSGNHYFS
jgi:hypothetical protein